MNKEEVLAAIEWVKSTPTDGLIVNKAGNLHFDIRQQVDDLKSTLAMFSVDGFNRLPLSQQGQMVSAALPILSHLNMAYSTVKDYGQADSHQLAPVHRYFKEHHGPDGYYRHVAALWPKVLETHTLGLTRQFESDEPSKKLKELQDIISGAAKSKGDLDGMLEAARVEVSKRGVDIHRALFDKMSGEYGSEAILWRSWAVGLFSLNCLLVLGTLVAVLWKLEAQSDAVKVEVGIFGAAVVSLVSFGIVFCVRNYFAARHNQALNLHKANCLGTYDTFRSSADPESKAAVLLQATHTIFSHQRTGYLSKEAEMTSPSPLLEFVRRIPAPGSE